jgi:hypothetical protein
MLVGKPTSFYKYPVSRIQYLFFSALKKKPPLYKVEVKERKRRVL